MEDAQGMGGGILWPKEAAEGCWVLRGGVFPIRILGPWRQILVAEINLCQKRKQGLAGGEVSLTLMLARVLSQGRVEERFLPEHKGLVLSSLIQTRDCSFAEGVERGG